MFLAIERKTKNGDTLQLCEGCTTLTEKKTSRTHVKVLEKSSTWNAIVWTATDTCERWSLGYLCTCISTTMTLLITCNFYFFLCNISHFFCTFSLLCEVFTRASFLKNTLNVPVSANLPFVILMKAAQSDRNVDRKTTEWRLVLGLIKIPWLIWCSLRHHDVEVKNARNSFSSSPLAHACFEIMTSNTPAQLEDERNKKLIDFFSYFFF